jgi:hypothetical protein
MVSEKPIIFSGEMVRAILDGRKTQTRRVIKPQPVEWVKAITFNEYLGEWQYLGYEGGMVTSSTGFPGQKPLKCPYGKPGDRLWVRKTWRRSFSQFGQLPDGIEFKANNLLVYFDKSDSGVQAKNAATEKNLPRDGRWRPSIHMPRWASRITLEITDIRVERVQNISFEDCRAEGCREDFKIDATGCPFECTGTHYGEKYHFIELWNSINAKRGYGWYVNPWVWVVEFRVIKNEHKE